MKTPLSNVRQPKKFDFILLTILILIFIGSLIAIYSSFPLMAAKISPMGTLLKQAAFYILGFIIILAIMYVGNDNLYDFAIIGYKITMFALIYLLLGKWFGNLPVIKYLFYFVHTANGATSWLVFPGIGTVQPSEFMKIILIIITAYVIKNHNEEKIDDSFESDLSLFMQVLKWALPPMILILLQPDTGVCLIIAFSLALMLACSGIRKEWIIGACLLVVIALGIFFYLFYFNQSLFSKIFGSGYKTRRIYGWLEAEERSTGDGMQLYTALLALGSAGISGHGVQSEIIPLLEPHTDFIFAVIGLNYGFIGCAITIILCMALDLRLCVIAFRTKNSIEKVMIIGFVGMLIFQQIQNIGMVCGLLPITGITLPLFSAGGSSLLSYMIAFGIIMNASAKAKKLSDYIYD